MMKTQSVETPLVRPCVAHEGTAVLADENGPRNSGQPVSASEDTGLRIMPEMRAGQQAVQFEQVLYWDMMAGMLVQDSTVRFFDDVARVIAWTLPAYARRVPCLAMHVTPYFQRDEQEDADE